MYKKLLIAFAQKAGIEVGDHAINKAIVSLTSPDERDKTYGLIKNKILVEPFSYTKQELEDYLFVAKFFDSLTGKKAPSDPLVILIPFYGLYKLWEYTRDNKKWTYLCEALIDLIKRRDRDEYTKMLKDRSYHSEYFDGFPQLLKKFKKYEEENDFYGMATLFVDLNECGKKGMQVEEVINKYEQQLQIEVSRLKRIKGIG
ncbi:hypothetical protein V7068_15385 [Bacillus sp. JJ634]